MTLIIAGINRENAFLASDRRISSNGVLVDDETTKCFFITTPDSRGVFAFTGLAYNNKFNTENLLVESLTTISKTETEIELILRRLKDVLNNKFTSKLIGRQNAFLTIFYIGYVYTNGNFDPRMIRISNFEFGGCEDNFIYTEHNIDGIQTAGQNNSVSESQKEKLLKLLNENRLDALNIVSYLTINLSSINPLSNNSVGRTANVCSFNSKIDTPMTSTYYSDKLSKKCYGAKSFTYQEGGFMVNLGSVLTVPNNAPSTVIPITKKYNLCPCGSSIKYKKCHKKIEYPYMTMFTRIKLTDNEYASGKTFEIHHIGAY